MNPNLNQSLRRYKGEGYDLAILVDLRDPDANAAGVTEAKLWVGGITLTTTTVSDADEPGLVQLVYTVAPTSFDGLAPGRYLWEASLKLGGDPVVVAGGTFFLLGSYTLEASS